MRYLPLVGLFQVFFEVPVIATQLYEDQYIAWDDNDVDYVVLNDWSNTYVTIVKVPIRNIDYLRNSANTDLKNYSYGKVPHDFLWVLGIENVLACLRVVPQTFLLINYDEPSRDVYNDCNISKMETCLMDVRTDLLQLIKIIMIPSPIAVGPLFSCWIVRRLIQIA